SAQQSPESALRPAATQFRLELSERRSQVRWLMVAAAGGPADLVPGEQGRDGVVDLLLPAIQASRTGQHEAVRLGRPSAWWLVDHTAQGRQRGEVFGCDKFLEIGS